MSDNGKDLEPGRGRVPPTSGETDTPSPPAPTRRTDKSAAPPPAATNAGRSTTVDREIPASWIAAGKVVLSFLLVLVIVACAFCTNRGFLVDLDPKTGKVKLHIYPAGEQFAFDIEAASEEEIAAKAEQQLEISAPVLLNVITVEDLAKKYPRGFAILASDGSDGIIYNNANRPPETVISRVSGRVIEGNRFEIYIENVITRSGAWLGSKWTIPLEPGKSRRMNGLEASVLATLEEGFVVVLGVL